MISQMMCIPYPYISYMCIHRYVLVRTAIMGRKICMVGNKPRQILKRLCEAEIPAELSGEKWRNASEAKSPGTDQNYQWSRVSHRPLLADFSTVCLWPGLTRNQECKGKMLKEEGAVLSSSTDLWLFFTKNIRDSAGWNTKDMARLQRSIEGLLEWWWEHL